MRRCLTPLILISLLGILYSSHSAATTLSIVMEESSLQYSHGKNITGLYMALSKQTNNKIHRRLIDAYNTVKAHSRYAHIMHHELTQ